MTRFPTPTFRTLVLGSLLTTLFLIVTFYEDIHYPLRIRDGIAISKQQPVGNFEKNVNGRVTGRLDLPEDECRSVFPDQFADIQYAKKKNKPVLEKVNGDYKGLVQGWIKGNKLYIISTAPDTASQILHQRTAVLSQLHRALITSPDPLPDTPFAFIVNDNPRNNSWVFARPNKESDYNVWLMPSFAFWSWPSSTLGTFEDILARIASVEERTPWEKKIDKAIWRGTPWFNPLGHPMLRQDLLKAARLREWADVASLNESAGNALAIEDFCRYKYVVYTEGVTYSGRLPYHQACESVLITAPLTYLTHTAWSVKPILSNDLLRAFEIPTSDSPTAQVPPSRPHDGLPTALLPTVSDWHLANAIYVSPKFSDLEEVVMLLRAHPEVARRIARNQREVVTERGHLSGAAEACYWRALVKAWTGSFVANEEWAKDVGERYETWLLKQVTQSQRTRKTGG